MADGIIGTRIREHRRRMGVTQTDMASRIGISASYLNLIESNKRRIAGALLQRAAGALGVTLEALEGAEERRLAEDLRNIAASPALVRLAPETDKTWDMVGRYPGWARAVAALARSEQLAQDRARALSERLDHDPFLGESVHRMLSRIAAVRSAAEILEEYSDMSADERRRFDAIILTETRALSEIGEALANYFDGFGTADRALTPQDEANALLAAHGNRFPEIEARASDLHRTGGGEPPANPDPSAFADLVAGIIDGSPDIQTAGGRAKAERLLLDYARRAVEMPLEPFGQLASALSYDAEVLGRQLGVPVSDVLRRLSALPPDAGHPSFSYLRVNASGSVLESFPTADLVVPSHAPPCPLWIAFGAQRSPGSFLRQRAVFTSMHEFLFVARAEDVSPAGFDTPAQYEVDMLAIPHSDAATTVYGTGGDLPAEEVGPACRLCARATCRFRVADPFLG